MPGRGSATLCRRLPKPYRFHVIGTACARHREFLRGLGADEVIDPTSARFDDKGWDADVVLTRWGAMASTAHGV